MDSSGLYKYSKVEEDLNSYVPTNHRVDHHPSLTSSQCFNNLRRNLL